MMKIHIFFYILFVELSYCVPDQDKVTYNIMNYTFPWYSGYLQFDTGRYHYVFFQSQRDPNNDPLILWLNGGPGCSSMYGMLYQNGPFTFLQNSTQMQTNNNSWNKIANMIYLQSPGGTGFSQSFRNDTYSDHTATEDNMKALRKFFQKFPTYKKNDFYITGQSYAGVFIPNLAKAILQYNKLASRELTIKFKGFMINNPCTDHRECYQPRIVHSNSVYQYQYMYNHGYFTQKQYLEMKSSCIMGFYTQQCYNIRKKLDTQFKNTNSSIYHIYLPCFYQKFLQLSNEQKKGQFHKPLSQQNKYRYTRSGGRIQMSQGYHCDDTIGYQTFLNYFLIQRQLHVDHVLFQDCRPSVATRYIKNPQQSYPLYLDLVKQNLTILIISGDHDADVPITGTLTWIKRLREQAGLPIIQPWREWWVRGVHKHQDQVAGMTWKLKGINFASVRSAGHMAHKDKKKQTFTLFNSFITATPFPYKDQSL